MCVPAENYSYLLVNTEFVFLFIFIICIIIYIFNRDFNYIHYYSAYAFIKTHLCKVFNKLCKVCATATLN